MKDARARVAAQMQAAFADFSRNGRWGTCGGCPCDGQGRQLPELCQDTDRNDHQLDMDQLAKQFNQRVLIEASKAKP